MNNFSHVEFNLENDQQQNERLIFDVHDNPVSQRWAACLQQASNKSQLLEKDRWYNFPGHQLSSIEAVVQALEENIKALNLIHPGLIEVNWNKQNPQETINELHIHFADSHLVQKRITEESYQMWFEFNNLLHAYEAVERSQSIETQAGIPNASMVVTWEDHFKQDLQDEDYAHFTIAKKFGTCYVNYCQVGRHIFEMFQAQDLELNKEHVLPLRSVSADTYLWFGQSTGKQGYAKKSEEIRKWFEIHQDYFSELGFKWGDPRLAIGWLPVATLRGWYDDLSSKQKLIQKISTMKRVSSVTVVLEN